MDKWHNIVEAAKLIGVSTKTLRRYCDKGLINFNLTAGGRYQFRQSAIDLYLSRHRAIKPTDKRKRGKKPKTKIPAYLLPNPMLKTGIPVLDSLTPVTGAVPEWAQEEMERRARKR